MSTYKFSAQQLYRLIKSLETDGHLTVEESLTSEQLTKILHAQKSSTERTKPTAEDNLVSPIPHDNEICCARIWSGGWGGRCSRKTISCSDYCTQHNKPLPEPKKDPQSSKWEQQDVWTSFAWQHFGRIDQPRCPLHPWKNLTQQEEADIAAFKAKSKTATKTKPKAKQDAKPATKKQTKPLGKPKPADKVAKPNDKPRKELAKPKKEVAKPADKVAKNASLLDSSDDCSDSETESPNTHTVVKAEKQNEKPKEVVKEVVKEEEEEDEEDRKMSDNDIFSSDENTDESDSDSDSDSDDENTHTLTIDGMLYFVQPDNKTLTQAGTGNNISVFSKRKQEQKLSIELEGDTTHIATIETDGKLTWHT